MKSFMRMRRRGQRAYAHITMSAPGGFVRRAGRAHNYVYRATRGRVFGKSGALPLILLTTTGRRSGRERTTPVAALVEDDRMVVIGSNVGHDRQPTWALNLKSNPEAQVRFRGESRTVRARFTEGSERDALWQAMNERFAGYDDYQANTERRLPVIVLEPRQGA